MPQRVLEVSNLAVQGLLNEGPDQLAPGMHAGLLAGVVRNLVTSLVDQGSFLLFSDLPGMDRAYVDLKHPVIGRWSSEFPMVNRREGFEAPLPGQFARSAKSGSPIRVLSENDLNELLGVYEDPLLLVIASSPLSIPKHLPRRRHIILLSPYPLVKGSVSALRRPLHYSTPAKGDLPRSGVWPKAQQAEKNSMSPVMRPTVVNSSDSDLAEADFHLREMQPGMRDYPGFVSMCYRINSRLQTNIAPFNLDQIDEHRPELGARSLLANCRGLQRVNRSPPTPSSPEFLVKAAACLEHYEHEVPTKGSWLREHVTELKGSSLGFDSRRAMKAAHQWLARAGLTHSLRTVKLSKHDVESKPLVVTGVPTVAMLSKLLFATAPECTILLYPWEARRFNQIVKRYAVAAERLGVDDWPHIPEAPEPSLPKPITAPIAAVPQFELDEDEDPVGNATVDDLEDDRAWPTVEIVTDVGEYKFRAGRRLLLLRDDNVDEIPAEDAQVDDIMIRLTTSSDAGADSVLGALCEEDPRMKDSLSLATSWNILLQEKVLGRYPTVSAAYRDLQPGVEEVQFRHWLHGDVVAPQRHNLRRLAEILKLPPQWADGVFAGAKAHYKDRATLRRHLRSLARRQAYQLFEASLSDDGQAMDLLLRATQFETIQERNYHEPEQ